ncbi:hypothetical protein JCM8547_001793 [Rhodosporidiobolus lusitaniae]
MASYLDDADPSVVYSGPWEHFVGSDGKYDATKWYGSTFASCGGNGTSNATGCEARLEFEGTRAGLYGDTTRTHGVFSCRIETVPSSSSSDPVEAETTWGWYYGGAQGYTRPYQLNATLCEITGLENRRHAMVLAVEPDQVEGGIALDYMRYETVEGDDGSSYAWSSFFNNAIPPQALHNTTATPSLPSSTGSSSPTSSSSSSGGGVNTLAVGLGAGLGGACLLVALSVAGWLLWRRRNSRGGPTRRNRLSSQATEGEGGNGYGAGGEGGGGDDNESFWRPGKSEVMAMGGTVGGGGVGEGGEKRDEGGYSYSPPRGSEGYGFAPLGSTSGAQSSRYSVVPTSTAPYGSSTYPTHSSSQLSFSSPSSAPYPSFAPHRLSASSTGGTPPHPSYTGGSPLLHPPTASPPHPSAAPADLRASRGSQDYAFLDLPHDAPLADPGEFAERR